METTEISKTHKDKSVFFQNDLENLWESDVITLTEDEAGKEHETERKPRRDWSIYSKERFRHFWNTETLAHLK